MQALIRSQGGPGGGAALSAVPTCSEKTIPSHLFRVVLLRRLRQSLPLSETSCRCGRLLDAFGHHCAACARVGMLDRRGFTLESTAARICREAGGRVRTNVLEGHGFARTRGGGCTEVGSRSGRSATSWGSSTSSGTPLWCAHCMLMAPQGGTLHWRTV